MSDRRELIRHAIQRGAESEGVEITEADEHMAVEFLDGLIPQDAEVLTTEEMDKLFNPEPTR